MEGGGEGEGEGEGETEGDTEGEGDGEGEGLVDGGGGLHVGEASTVTVLVERTMSEPLPTEAATLNTMEAAGLWGEGVGRSAVWLAHSRSAAANIWASGWF
jgi:hypothetical protein